MTDNPVDHYYRYYAPREEAEAYFRMKWERRLPDITLQEPVVEVKYLSPSHPENNGWGRSYQSMTAATSAAVPVPVPEPPLPRRAICLD